MTSATALTADENTPLLGAPDTAGGKALQQIPEDSEDGQSKHSSTSDGVQYQPGPVNDDKGKHMPYKQVILLCFDAFIDPLSYFAIFPIIGDMLVRTGGLDVKEIAIWAGIIESLFSIVQMMVMIQYGKLSDRYGRKPVLVFSLFGVAVTSALFGLSQSLWHMILLRACTGFFAGSSVTIRAMLSEVTNKNTQARAFSWYMFSRQIGIFIGPLLGGCLASPNEVFGFFNHNAFFEQFPYSLSMFATSAVCFSAAIITMTSVNETLNMKDADDGEASEPPMTTWELLKAPGVGPVIYINGHVALIALVYTAVNPVFSYTPVDLGGFGWSKATIGIFVATAGASQAAWMLIPFPPLQRRYGTGAVLRACVVAWPFLFLILPLSNELLRRGLDISFWIIAPFTAVVGSGVSMAFACVQLCVNDIAPTSNTLGTLNAIVLTVGSAIRAVAPILGTGLYEVGVKGQWIDGHLIWVFLFIVAATLCIGVRWLPPQAEGKPVKSTSDEES